jgi:hypothetical protein
MMAQAVDKGTIEGDVVNVSSGRGIPGAQVQLQAGDDKPLFTSTDERGHFRFENLALQIYQLQAHSPGMMNVPPERDAPAAAIVVLHRFRLHAEVRLELKPSESGIGKDGDDSGRRAQYRAAITIMPPQIHVADIDGEAISKLTGEPIAGVKISRQSRETVSVTTDMNGHFHMPGVPGLHSTLTATKSGFLRRSFEVAIKPEDSRITLKFEITPQAVIAGKVVNENGAPVPAARVTAALYRRVGGDRKLRGVEHAVTNDLGEYRLGNLPAGKYYVQAAAGITPLFRDARFALVYYPSAVDPRGASTIEVTAGQETHDIVLPMALHTGVEIRGRVIWPAGYEPSRQEYGHLRHEDPLAPMNWPFPIASDGTFIVQFVPPGKYGISVEAGGDVERLQPPRYTAGRLLDVAGEKLEGVVLMPAATHLGELKGKIEIEGRSKTNVVPVGWIVLSSLSFEFKAEIEADGSFRIPSVGQGIYILGISPPPPVLCEIRSLRHNGHSRWRVLRSRWFRGAAHSDRDCGVSGIDRRGHLDRRWWLPG